MSARDPLAEDLAKRDGLSIGNVLLDSKAVDELLLERALEITARAKESGRLNRYGKPFRVGDALVEDLGVSETVVELAANKQEAERLVGESSTYITQRMARRNIAQTYGVIATAYRAIALTTPTKPRK